MGCWAQVEALLDRVQGGPPVADALATRLEALGYSSWAYRVINTAGAPRVALALICGRLVQFFRRHQPRRSQCTCSPCLGDPQTPSLGLEHSCGASALLE